MATSTTPQPDAADPPENPPRAWTLTKGGAFQWVQGPPGDSLLPEAIRAVMEVTKWLKPSNSGHDLVTAQVCRPGAKLSCSAQAMYSSPSTSPNDRCRPAGIATARVTGAIAW